MRDPKIPPIRKSSRKRLLLTLSLLVCGTCGMMSAAPAVADSISLGVPADLVEDVPFNVTASGVASPDYLALATIKPAGGRVCAPNYQADDGESILFGDVSNGFSVVGPVTRFDEGNYLLCGWVQEFSDSVDAVAQTSLPIRVRKADASLTISPDPRPAGQPSTLLISGRAELERALYVSVKNAGGIGCGASSELDTGSSVFVGDVQGTISQTINLGSLPAASYLACAWIQESSSDPRPEAATSASFTIPGAGQDIRPPDPPKPPVTAACTNAKSKEAALKRKAAQAKRKWKKARGSAKKKAKRAYKKAKNRYQAATKARIRACNAGQ